MLNEKEKSELKKKNLELINEWVKEYCEDRRMRKPFIQCEFIHAMGNGKYTLKAVRRGKNGWGKAGVNDTTAPF